MHVLIVEDDAALGPFLQRGLMRQGHEVTLAADGETGLSQALEHRPDLIILDLGLPRKDGIEVLRAVEGHLRGSSILVLTGRGDVQDRVQCLDLGADDCLHKPFSFHELTARCNALLRRRKQYADPMLRHGAIELNRMERRVSCEGRQVELTGKEFALLQYLMQARGRCCSRSELLREVWQMSPEAGTNVVDVYVNYLRKKLVIESRPGIEDGNSLIETVRGEGYMLSMGIRKGPLRSVESSIGEANHYAAPLFRVGTQSVVRA